jgi:hypothetical protein
LGFSAVFFGYLRAVRARVSALARVALAVAAALLGSASSAAGQSPPGDGAPGAQGQAPPDAASLVAGPSACPLPDAVWGELGTLVPRDRFEARLRAAAGATPPVEIFDLGTTYRVIAAGRVRTYHDEGRDCANRARIAALFVALAIDPADVISEPPPPPRAAPTPAATAVPVAAPAVEGVPPPRPLARVDLGGAVDAGVGTDAAVAQGGLSLAAVIGRGRFAAVAGAVLLAPVDTDIAGVRIHQWRVPFFAGVRGHLDRQRVEPYAELGLEAAWLRERAPDLAAPASQDALEVGVAASLGARLPTGVGPFAALRAELVPSPPEIFALPQGVLGRTPTIWLGLTAGLSLGLVR